MASASHVCAVAATHIDGEKAPYSGHFEGEFTSSSAPFTALKAKLTIASEKVWAPLAPPRWRIGSRTAARGPGFETAA